MPENLGEKYEDSYQKRERLENELRETLIELKKYTHVFRQDISTVEINRQLLGAYLDELEDIEFSEMDLLIDIDAQTYFVGEPDPPLLEVGDEKIREEIEKRNNELEKKLKDMWKKFDELKEKNLKKKEEVQKKISGLVEEVQGGKGDATGTWSTLTSLIKRAEKLETELREFDN